MLTKVGKRAGYTRSSRSRLQKQGEEVARGTPEQFAALLRGDCEKYRTIVASAGIDPK